MQERHRHQALRDEAGAFRRLAGEARILEHVLDHERLPADEDEAGDPGAGGEAAPDERVRSLARHGLEHELVRRLVEQENRGGLCLEDRPRDLDDR